MFEGRYFVSRGSLRSIVVILSFLDEVVIVFIGLLFREVYGKVLLYMMRNFFFKY